MSMRFLQKSKVLDMTEGTIVSKLAAFALPLFAGNMFQQVYNTVDSFFVGNFLGRDALAAIGASSQFVFTMIGFFQGFSTGAQVVISQAFGAKNIPRLERAIHTAMLSSLVLSVFMTASGILISPLVLRLLSVPESVFGPAAAYLQIYFAGISFLILYNMASGILRALGDTRRPLYFLIFSSLVNIDLDALFVLGFKWGIKGAAWATVISQGISIIPVLFVLMKSGGVCRLRLRELRIDIPLLKEILRIGLPGAISSSITAFSNTFIQKYVNAFTASCSAGWAVFVRLDQLMQAVMMSISLSAMTFVSQNYGAGKFLRIQKGIRAALCLKLALVGFFSLLLFFFSKSLTAIFIDDAASVRYGSLFIRSTAPFYLLCATCMFYSQVLRGLGTTLIPTIITFSGFVVLRQTFLLVTTRLTDSFFVVSLAYPVVWIFTTIAIVCYYRFYWKNLNHSSLLRQI